MTTPTSPLPPEEAAELIDQNRTLGIQLVARHWQDGMNVDAIAAVTTLPEPVVGHLLVRAGEVRKIENRSALERYLAESDGAKAARGV